MGMRGTDAQVTPLYRRLPHGPSVMSRDQIARNQRIRLFGAMIEAVSQRGYSATKVADVIALAGVSRRAFYEQFHNKEHCFLATHDILVARERKRVIEAWRRERGWANSLRAGCKALLDGVAADPKGARLVLVETLGSGARARQRTHLAGIAFERLIESVLQIAPGRRELPPLTPRAIVGGVRQILHARVRDGRQRELKALTDEVLEWIDGCRSPAAARLAALGARPALRLAASPPECLEGEGARARALRSLMRLIFDEGYRSLRDSEIAQFAGISTEAFHRQFRDKEQCFLALLEDFTGEALRAARGPLEASSSWPQGVDRAMAAFVEYLLGHPDLLRIAFVEPFEMGPGVAVRLTQPIEAFTALLTEAAPAPRRGPLLAREAVAGAIWAILAGHVAGGRVSRGAGLIDQLSFTVLAPYIGATAAVDAIEAGRGRMRGA